MFSIGESWGWGKIYVMILSQTILTALDALLSQAYKPFYRDGGCHGTATFWSPRLN